MSEIDKLQKIIEQLYYLLRDEGFSIHAQIIKRLLANLRDGNMKKFRKNMNSELFGEALVQLEI